MLPRPLPVCCRITAHAGSAGDRVNSWSLILCCVRKRLRSVTGLSPAVWAESSLKAWSLVASAASKDRSSDFFKRSKSSHPSTFPTLRRFWSCCGGRNEPHPDLFCPGGDRYHPADGTSASGSHRRLQT